MNYFICLFFSLVACLNIFSQERIQLAVVDKKNAFIPYSNVIINRKSQILADRSGLIEINKDRLSLNDSIVVSFIGYKPYLIVVDQNFLNQSRVKIVLTEQVYCLDEIKIETSFNAERFLKKVKKKSLGSYNKKRKVKLIVDLKEIVDNKTLHKLDTMLFDYKYSYADTLLISTHITDSIIRNKVMKAFDKSSFFPYFFCNKKYSKYFDLKYLGRRGKQFVFSSILKKKYYKYKIFKLNQDDQFNILFNVNDSGFVTHAKYHLINEDNKDMCYQFDVDYEPYKNFITPTDIDLRFYYCDKTIHITVDEGLD